MLCFASIAKWIFASHKLCFKSKSAVSQPEFVVCMQMQQSTEYTENLNLEWPHGENVVKLIEAFFFFSIFCLLSITRVTGLK